MATPVKIANANVVLDDGTVLDGNELNEAMLISNQTARISKVLPNRSLLLSNGNIVAPDTSKNQTSTPVTLTPSHVVMSNGNSITNSNVRSFVKEKEREMSKNSSRPLKRCAPAPFFSQGVAGKYFRTDLAYGFSDGCDYD